MYNNIYSPVLLTCKQQEKVGLAKSSTECSSICINAYQVVSQTFQTLLLFTGIFVSSSYTEHVYMLVKEKYLQNSASCEQSGGDRASTSRLNTKFGCHIITYILYLAPVSPQKCHLKKKKNLLHYNACADVAYAGDYFLQRMNPRVVLWCVSAATSRPTNCS